MIVVLASRFDHEAAALAGTWGAALLTASDLSRAGWCFEPAEFSRSTAFLAGRRVPFSVLTGVLTLQPRVFHQELAHIIEEDRRYVASEMTAFLLAWLTALPCPVVNRPHPGCLSGPPWGALRWRLEAERAGFRHSEDEFADATLNVVSGECFGASDPTLEACALRLASAADVDLLSIRLDRRSAVVSANPRPDLTDQRIVVALTRLLNGERP